jgi:hypothetical protein
MKTILALLLAFTTSDAALAGCSVKKSDYAALKMMMTYLDVVKALGCNGERISEENGPGMVSTTYVWDGAIPRSTIMLVFGNGQLRSRSQQGLD